MVRDQSAGAHSDLAVKIYGEDLRETRLIAEKVEHVLKRVPGAVDVAVDQEPPLPQLQIIADRDRIAQYGLCLLYTSVFRKRCAKWPCRRPSA